MTPALANVAGGAGEARPATRFVGVDALEWTVADANAPPAAGHHGTVEQLFDRQDPLGSFAAGFLGAGLIGLLFGHGFFSGLNGPGTIFGVVFQFVLILIFVRLLRVRWRADRAGAGSPLSPRELTDAYERVRPDGQNGSDGAGGGRHDTGRNSQLGLPSSGLS